MSLKGEFGNMCVYMQHDRSRTSTTAYVYMHVRELQPLSEIDVLGSCAVRMRLTLANSRYMHVHHQKGSTGVEVAIAPQISCNRKQQRPIFDIA